MTSRKKKTLGGRTCFAKILKNVGTALVPEVNQHINLFLHMHYVNQKSVFSCFHYIITKWIFKRVLVPGTISINVSRIQTSSI